VHRSEDFHWLAGAREAIKLLNEADYLVFIVTNQSGIARGMYDEAAVAALHDWLCRDLARIGARVDDIRYCPHHPEGAVAAYSGDCDCRKPRPGMLEDLITHWQVDRAGSFILGDSPRDISAGKAADIRGQLVAPGQILAAVRAELARN
jgi:D-glycero-D-manno-heptose 1,7-bisphosphate phosphatase